MKVTKISGANFDSEVLQSEKTVLLDFFATWCGPCKMVAPILEEIAEENDGVKVVKADVDEEGELARRFGIMSIPTLVIIKDGKEVNRAVGYKPKEDILALI